MGCGLSLDNCRVVINLAKNRKWTYSLDKPNRFITEKYGGEWTGWFQVGNKQDYRIFHTLPEPVFFRIQIWIRKGEKWEQRSDIICPEIESFQTYERRMVYKEPGVYKLYFEVRNKEGNVLSRTLTFQISRTVF